MQSKLFWKNWPGSSKLLYIFFLLLAAGIVVWFAFFYFSGTENIIGWDTLAITERINVLIDTFRLGPFSLNTSEDNILFFQQFLGSKPVINTFSYYTILFITVISVNILLVIVTNLPKFWYFIGIALFAVILVNFKFEIILLFGSENKWGLILAFIFYFPLSYYFHSINPTISFAKRFAVFILLTFLFGLLIYFSAGVETPFFYLSVYGMINPLLISLIFILMVAHEIIAAFMYLLTSSKQSSSKNTVIHFYIISAIYMANLILAYLYETHVINWNIIYINLFLLLFISAVLGLWGFKQRESQYENIFNFYPNGAFLFITMFMCCFITLAHFTATLNDPAIEVFRDIIIYAHLGFGIIFLVYVTANFLDPLKRNLQVYKVLYRPTGMPYFTFRLAGMIAIVAFVLKSNWEVPVNQGISAYYNGIGDLHYYNGELSLAEAYYQQGAIFGYNNHKSHYMLGNLLHRKKDDIKAAVQFKAASQKNPTPQAFVNLSDIYFKQNRFFDAIFTLNDGLERFPDNPKIQNNMGIAYSKTNILDTAIYYLSNAIDNNTHGAVTSNLIGILAKNDIHVNIDSALTSFEMEEDPISLNNSYVLKNKNREYYNKDYTPEDSTLTFLESSILYNSAFNNLFDNDTLSTSSLVSFANLEQNTAFDETLTLAACLNWYNDSNVNKAFRELNWLANNSSLTGGKYFNLLGLWALQQNAPEIAVDHFSWAADRYSNQAPFNKAIALTESVKLTAALKAWHELNTSGDENVKKIAVNMVNILEAPQEDLAGYNDSQKYLFLRYRISYQDTAFFNTLIDKIEDNNYKAQALFDMSSKLWDKDLTEPAVNYYLRLAGLEISDKALFDRVQWYELKMLAAQGNIRGLATKINQGISFDKEHIIEKHYYSGLISEASGDTLNAGKHYHLIAYLNPFKEEATIAAASYIGLNDKFEAYDILLNAIELNASSVKLLKAYILQCARVQLNNYAAISLEDLSQLISPQAYRTFLQDYNNLVNKVTEEEDKF